MLKSTFAAAGLSFVVCGAASASFTKGGSAIMPYKGTASVQFVSQSAGARGSLYFVGHETDGVITHATSTDSNNLGQFLFSNHGTAGGYTVDLSGIFPSASILHFAYIITKGVSNAPTGQVTRTDNATGSWYGVGSLSTTLTGDVQAMYVEDIINGSSDKDYNDLVFNVRSLAIPAPGGAALIAAAGLVALPRRRHEKKV